MLPVSSWYPCKSGSVSPRVQHCLPPVSSAGGPFSLPRARLLGRLDVWPKLPTAVRPSRPALNVRCSARRPAWSAPVFRSTPACPRCCSRSCHPGSVLCVPGRHIVLAGSSAQVATALHALCATAAAAGLELEPAKSEVILPNPAANPDLHAFPAEFVRKAAQPQSPNWGFRVLQPVHRLAAG